MMKKFRHYLNERIYDVEFTDENVIVSWKDLGVIDSVDYTFKEVAENLFLGIWVLVED